MDPDRLDNATARRLFLHRHALGTAPTGSLTRAGLAALIGSLGFVQVDSINTVARAHDMILAARSTAYQPQQLKKLAERDRAVFEHWTHDAAIIPVAFFPYWMRRFAREAPRLRARWRRWHGEAGLAEAARVLDHVRDGGPIRARDLSGDRRRPSGGWWDWHPAKVALEFLWRTGDLAVTRRDGFQKVYDLTERVIPAEHRKPSESEAAMIGWACRGALDRLGFASSGELAAFWALVTPEEAAAWCRGALRDGFIRPVLIEGCGQAPPRRGFIRPEILAQVAELPPSPPRLRVLSPFDPALRDRARAERLFGFRYRIEVFTPAPKRRYGYYVFPLLEGERLVGRIDMTAPRETGALAVRALWPEAGVQFGKQRMARLEAELARVARFAGCERITVADDWLREPAA